MKIYSEKLNQLFDTADACAEAEKAYDNRVSLAEQERAKKAEERKLASRRVEDAYKKVREARKEYDEELGDFCKKYGSYHCTYDMNTYPSMLRTLFDLF